ncbi:hypothetical protein [Burkholderia sp. lig30]|uniref:hypothetical protein n=1 Tax=Burkholderia sp. lig30 TaxID=1192124 RepID=UPI00128FA306|nr:hypothetical protein [Burkholderia sp. lig30]
MLQLSRRDSGADANRTEARAAAMRVLSFAHAEKSRGGTGARVPTRGRASAESGPVMRARNAFFAARGRCAASPMSARVKRVSVFARRPTRVTDYARRAAARTPHRAAGGDAIQRDMETMR